MEAFFIHRRGEASRVDWHQATRRPVAALGPRASRGIGAQRASAMKPLLGLWEEKLAEEGCDTPLPLEPEATGERGGEPIDDSLE